MYLLVCKIVEILRVQRGSMAIEASQEVENENGTRRFFR
jgi:hypothetical protein